MSQEFCTYTIERKYFHMRVYYTILGSFSICLIKKYRLIYLRWGIRWSPVSTKLRKQTTYKSGTCIFPHAHPLQTLICCLTNPGINPIHYLHSYRENQIFEEQYLYNEPQPNHRINCGANDQQRNQNHIPHFFAERCQKSRTRGRCARPLQQKSRVHLVDS